MLTQFQSQSELLGPTQQLANYIANFPSANISSSAREEASKGVLNWLGCCLGGSQSQAINSALLGLRATFGPPAAGIYGKRLRTDVLNAALFNGIASHVLDFDDTHSKTMHPSAPILPAVFALAEANNSSGSELLDAYIIGVDSAIRIAMSVTPEHYLQGWHITATAGVFGSAAAASRLLKLNAEQTAHALGLAATQASGLRFTFGTMAKSMHAGQAARNGLLSALLASSGFTAGTSSIETKNGFGAVMSNRFDPEQLTADLGQRFEIEGNMYKPYPCGLVLHAAIFAVLELRKKRPCPWQNIASIEATVGPLVQELTAIPNPTNALQSKFSIFHALAVAAIRRSATVADFDDAAVIDRDIQQLRQHIHLKVSSGMHKQEAFVRIFYHDGFQEELHVPRAPGSLDLPLTKEMLENKFLNLSSSRISQAQQLDILQIYLTVGELDSLDRLFDALH